MANKDIPRREPKTPRVKSKRVMELRKGNYETMLIGRYAIETGWNAQARKLFVQVIEIRHGRRWQQEGETFFHSKISRCDTERDRLFRELAIEQAAEALGVDA